MKKFLPVIILVFGLAVFAVVFILVKSKGAAKTADDNQQVLIQDLPLDKKPVVSLTPTSDGHYLTLKIDKLDLGAKTLDYMLLYQTSDGIPQGVPGTVDVNGKDSFQTDLLLGSESSGKFRYDDGVENGNITLSFRNDKGKLIAKVASDFHLQSQTDQLTSPDSKFTYTLNKKPKTGFFVVINTQGVPGTDIKSISSGPWGVFSSEGTAFPGDVKFESSGEVKRYSNGSWTKMDSTSSDSLGIFLQ